MAHGLPSNHSPAFAPVIEPTLATGVAALVAGVGLAARGSARSRPTERRTMSSNVTPPSRWSTMGRRALSNWVVLLLVLLVVSLIAQNRQRVSIHLLFLEMTSPLWFVLFLTTLAGAVIGALSRRRRRTRGR